MRRNALRLLRPTGLLWTDPPRTRRDKGVEDQALLLGALKRASRVTLYASKKKRAFAVNDQLAVRPVVKDDFPQWKPLWDGYNAFYGRAGQTALPLEVTQVTWSRFFDAAEPMHALVAEDAGKLLGLAHFLFHRSTIQIAPTCYLQDLFTVEQARGKGVGRALISAVYQFALAAGSPRVYWQTHESNKSAMQLYDKIAEKSGFVVYRKLL
jgi:GNAT superfamily N-acetyltransferase